MSKFRSVENIKPVMESVDDLKPSGEAVVRVKPVMKSVENPLQLHDLILGAGMPMGLLLALTYPTSETIISPKSP